jgi:transposase
VTEKFGWNLEVVSQAKTELVTITGDDGEPKEVPIKVKGFQVIPRLWVVERTFAWCSRNRSLSKDYELVP